MTIPIVPPTIMPARNSSIAAEPTFDPVAQPDQTKPKADQRHRRGITRPGEDRDEARQFGKLTLLGQEKRATAGQHRQQPRPPGERCRLEIAHGSDLPGKV